MSFKNTPITAKIKRTTQGGMVQQPLLNMGGPVKMKMSSPAKVDLDPTKQKQSDFKNEMSKQDKAKADNLAAGKAKKAAKDESNYQKSVDQYRKDVSTLNANTKSASKNVNPRQMESAMNRSVRQAGRIKSFEKNLYDYDTKNKAGSTEGYTAKEYAMSKASGTYKPRNNKKEESKTLTPKNLKARSEGEAGWAADDKARKNKTGIYKPTGKKSYEQAYKDTRNHKVYGKMDKATYIKEAKRQNASKKAGKGWDVKGEGKDTPPRKKVTASTIKPVGIKKVEISTKLDPKQLKADVVKRNTKTEKPSERNLRKANRKAESAGRASDRAARARLKGQQALENGNKQKALRLKRKETRLKAKATKKRGQAADAIKIKD